MHCGDTNWSLPIQPSPVHPFPCCPNLVRVVPCDPRLVVPVCPIHTVCYCAARVCSRWQRTTSIWFRLESAARLLTLALTTYTQPLLVGTVAVIVDVVVARGLALGQARFNPTQNAASTLLGTVLTIKSQYRHLVFAPKSGGEMSQPATGHEAPSPRHPGHCDHSATGQYADSLSA